MPVDQPLEAQRLRAVAVPDLETATWSNGIRFGNEILMSGMTAHPATRNADKPLTTYEQTLVVLGKIRALVEAGADVNIADRSGATPLSLAKDRGYAAMVAILEKAGVR